MTSKPLENENADQGFNETELEDIMNEIESLEKEFSDVTETHSHIVASASPELLVIPPKDVQKTSLQASIDEELERLHKAPLATVTAANNVVTMPAPKAPEFSGKGAKTEMSFSVAGEMAINLQFQFSGQCVNIVVDEQNGLVINLGNGARFVLPINKNKAA